MPRTTRCAAPRRARRTLMRVETCCSNGTQGMGPRGGVFCYAESRGSGVLCCRD
ncbi:MAG: hypothetical protein HY744_04125 [Deltaproteobacteria bacterium]|nr:hypothetical protein [Deltaproteobacteria bacterium]